MAVGLKLVRLQWEVGRQIRQNHTQQAEVEPRLMVRLTWRLKNQTTILAELGAIPQAEVLGPVWPSETEFQDDLGIER